MWGSAPRPGRGAPPLHPAIWGFAPRDIVFGGLSLLGLCVPIWGYAPSPARAAWRGVSFLLEMKLQRREVPHKATALSLHISLLSEFKPLAWGFGAKPQMETQSQNRMAPTNS